MHLNVKLYVHCPSCFPVLQPHTNLQATNQNYIYKQVNKVIILRRRANLVLHFVSSLSSLKI